MINERIEISQGPLDTVRVHREGSVIKVIPVDIKYVINLYRGGWRPVKETRVNGRTDFIFEKKEK